MNEPVSQVSLAPAPAHQALYRRWRAQTFDQIVGQQPVVETLRNAVRLDQVAHAILFVGPRGTGKTSLARIVAKALNCTDLRDGDPCDRCPSCVAIREGATLDVLEIDAASNRGINEIKELRDRLNYAPSQLRKKVYILDEAHQITKDAWNALLKSLEEPPPFVVFMFASTHPQDFPPAILSRLQRFDVRRLTVPEIEGKLQRILEAEGRTAEPAAVTLIARLAAGGMRDAESMLDQLLASAPDVIAESGVRALLGLADAEAVDGFVAALVEGDARTGIRLLDDLDERGHDARAFLDQVVDALRESIGASLASGRDATALATAARRLAGIDPNRAGIGGLRLQLELALLSAARPEVGVPPRGRTAPEPAAAEPLPAAPKPAPKPAPSEPAAPEPAPSAPAEHEPAPPRASRSGTTVPPVRGPGGAPATADPGSTAASEPTAVGRAMVDLPTEPVSAAEGGGAAVPNGPVPAGDVDAAPTTGTSSASGADGADTAAAVPDAMPGAPSDDLVRLRELWPDIVSYISRHPPTKPLIAVCRPIAADGRVVTLGFPEDQAFLREVATRRRPNLEEGIAHFLGHEVSVRCVATNLDLVPPIPADADAEFVLAEARRIFADDTSDVGEVG